jgi:hypothetical protein
MIITKYTKSETRAEMEEFLIAWNKREVQVDVTESLKTLSDEALKEEYKNTLSLDNLLHWGD